MTEVLRIAAFSQNGEGGNPAGVMIGATLPDEERMQDIAREVGFSETAFAAPEGDGWRVRYFAPEMEVPFCGHATIALGAALAMQNGSGTFKLQLNKAAITVKGAREGKRLSATLQSPSTESAPAPGPILDRALKLFSLREDDLDGRIPPAIAQAGARHLILALKSREKLRQLAYDFDEGRSFMLEHGLVTISVLFIESETMFHSRNPFAFGGVYEDPATGAAAAALAGYLRDIGWPHGGKLRILQGEDMGAPSLLEVALTEEKGASIAVSGEARVM